MQASGNLRFPSDGRPVAHQMFGYNYTLRAPCPGGSIDQAFATSAFGGDGVHTIELGAVDAGGNAVAVSRTVRIDNTAPDAPQNLVVAGGDGWRGVNGFDVAWTNPSQSGRAPITAALYELCPMPSGPCTKGSAQGSGVSSISGLHVPAPGEYRMRVWLQDAAGNQDIRLAAPAAFLRYDDTSPLVTIEAPQPDDPTLVVADVTDSGSGLAGGTIALRRREGTKWHTLDTAVDGSRLVAHIDDEHLADGTYVLRASAVDQAGNEKSTDERGDGQPALLILPLRLKTRLRAGVVQLHHHHLRLAHKASVRYGQVVRVRGRLTTPEGNPLQGVSVDVYSRLRGQAAPPQLVATVRTSRKGRFSFRVRKGPSRTITLHFAGTPRDPERHEGHLLERASHNDATSQPTPARQWGDRALLGPRTDEAAACARQAHRHAGVGPRPVADIRDDPRKPARPLALRLPVRRDAWRPALSFPCPGARRGDLSVLYGAIASGSRDGARRLTFG